MSGLTENHYQIVHLTAATSWQNDSTQVTCPVMSAWCVLRNTVTSKQNQCTSPRGTTYLSANGDIRRILRHRNVYCRVHNSPHWSLRGSKWNPVHTLPIIFLSDMFQYYPHTFGQVFQAVFFLQISLRKSCMYVFSLPSISSVLIWPYW